jgi:hypothetical protein
MCQNAIGWCAGVLALLSWVGLAILPAKIALARIFAFHRATLTKNNANMAIASKQSFAATCPCEIKNLRCRKAVRGGFVRA